MSSFLSWLDKPKQRFPRVAFVQASAILALLIVISNNSMARAVLIMDLAALFAVFVAALALVADKSWNLVLSNLVVALFEGAWMLLAGVIQFNEKIITIQSSAFTSGLLIIVGSFIFLMVSVAYQNRGREELLPPS